MAARGRVLRDGSRVGGITRHDDQRGALVRRTSGGERVEQRFVLALVQTAADDHDVAVRVAQSLTQLGALHRGFGRAREIVFHVARDSNAFRRHTE